MARLLCCKARDGALRNMDKENEYVDGRYYGRCAGELAERAHLGCGNA